MLRRTSPFSNSIRDIGVRLRSRDTFTVQTHLHRDAHRSTRGHARVIPPPSFFLFSLMSLTYFVISKFVSPVRTTLIEFMVNIMCTCNAIRSKNPRNYVENYSKPYRARDTRLIIRRGKVYGKVFGILKSRQCRQWDLSNATLNVTFIRSVAIV